MSPNVPSEKDSVLALALASGATIIGAAEQFGVDRKTVQRKLAEPAFQRQVAELRDRMLSTALGRMADGMTCAVDKLRALLDDQNPSIRLRAIRAMIGLGVRLRESVDLSARVRALEAEWDEGQEVLP